MDSYQCYSVFEKEKKNVPLFLRHRTTHQTWHWHCLGFVRNGSLLHKSPAVLLDSAIFIIVRAPYPHFCLPESSVWSFFQLSKQCHILELCQKIMSKLRSSGTSVWNFNFARNTPIIYCLFSAKICFVFPLLDHFFTITRMMAIAAVLQMPSRRTISTCVSKSHLCS